MKKVILLIIVLLVFCGLSSANENKILEEKVALTIEFPLPVEDVDINEIADFICIETAQNASDKREGTYYSNLNSAVINVDEKTGIGKLSCSFELKRGAECSCQGQLCEDGGQVNSCRAYDCPDGQEPYCDCGSCDGIRRSVCKCW